MSSLYNMRRRLGMARTYATHLLPRMPRISLAAIGALPVSMLMVLAASMFSFALACALAPAPAWAASATEASSAQDSGEATVDSNNTVNARQTADNSFLYDTSVYELVQADATYQGQTVQIVGEVVGDNIRAEEDPGKVWITLEAIEEDYESSISVLVNESTLNLIDTYGAYNRKGTTLQVRGTFYLACPSHEGILDIHAESVTLVASGRTSKDAFVPESFTPGLVLCGLGIVLALLYHYLRERER